MRRTFLFILSLVSIASTVSIASAQTTQLSVNQSERYANYVDQTVMTDSADAWSAGTLHNAIVLPDSPPRVTLAYDNQDFPILGTWTSEEVKAEMPFTELLASFNVSTPKKTGVTLDIRVKIDDEWSPWIYIQSWGQTLTQTNRIVEFANGKLDIDTLMLKKPAQMYQARVTLHSFDFDPKVRPSIRRLTVIYSGEVADAKERAELRTPIVVPANWARDLPVPFRGQGDYKNPRSLWNKICSPTSTSMVMEYWGVNRTTQENAEAIFDPQYNMFGNWGRAVSRAGELGLDAWLERFRNYDQLKKHIADGVPVIASIRFKKGEVQGFLYESTAGHLIVIRGMTPEGDLIVNDPARRDAGAHVIYRASEMAKAWFNHGGVGYVIHAPAHPATTQPVVAGQAPG